MKTRVMCSALQVLHWTIKTNDKGARVRAPVRRLWATWCAKSFANFVVRLIVLSSCLLFTVFFWGGGFLHSYCFSAHRTEWTLCHSHLLSLIIFNGCSASRLCATSFCLFSSSLHPLFISAHNPFSDFRSFFFSTSIALFDLLLINMSFSGLCWTQAVCSC